VRVLRFDPRIRAGRGGDEKELVARQQLRPGPRHRGPRDARVLLAEHDVELVGEQAREGQARILVGDLDAEPGVALGQLGEDRGHQSQQHRLERGDAQRAAHLGQRGAQLGLGLLQLLEDRPGMRDKHPRLGGEPDAAPGRLEQDDAGLGLQLAQLLRDRRRAVRQRPGHGGERAATVQLAQQPQPVNVKHCLPRALGTSSTVEFGH
jgi:hypothetical protein